MVCLLLVLSVKIKQFESLSRSSRSSHSHSSKHSRRTLASLGETRMDLMAKAIELKISKKKLTIKEEQLILDIKLNEINLEEVEALEKLITGVQEPSDSKKIKKEANLASQTLEPKSNDSDNQVAINKHTDRLHSKSDRDDVPVSSMMNSVLTCIPETACCKVVTTSTAPTSNQCGTLILFLVSHPVQSDTLNQFCSVSKEEHCSFTELPSPAKVEFVHKHKLCYNCLSTARRHSSKDCPTNFSWKHYTLLHDPDKDNLKSEVKSTQTDDV